MVDFSNRFIINPFQKHLIRLSNLMDRLEKLESMGGSPMTELTEDDKKNAQVAIKYLETAMAILQKSDKSKLAAKK